MSLANTRPIQGLYDAFQQYGYNRASGVPLMQGGTGNSVYQALTSGKIGPAQAYASELPQGGGGGGGGGGSGGDDGWVDPMPIKHQLVALLVHRVAQAELAALAVRWLAHSLDGARAVLRVQRLSMTAIFGDGMVHSG